MKFRFEVLFKEFHSRKNLKTLFKSYLLNTIKTVSGFESRSFSKLQKYFQRRYPEEPVFKNFDMWNIEQAQKTSGKFYFSRYGLGCTRGKNCCQRRRRVTDGFFIGFSRFMTF
jgi:hypothetical protein